MLANVFLKKYQNMFKLFEFRIEPCMGLGSDAGALGQCGEYFLSLRGNREIPQKGKKGEQKNLV